jgi:hypothetical protein
MLRGTVRYACGAEAQLLYPEGEPGVLERKRREAAAHECPYCSGAEGRGDLAEGLEALLSAPTLERPDGTLDIFHWKDVTDGRAAG